MRKHTYTVIWKAPMVSLQDQQKDMKRILEECASIEKRDPGFAFFGGMIAIEDRQYQVTASYESENKDSQ